MTDLAALKAANGKRWANARLTRGAEFSRFAAKAVTNKTRYRDVEGRTGVHWCFIAASHYRESTMDFTRQLGQGDPLDRVSVHVPAGRGPFLGPKGFEDAAYDALVNCAPYAARNSDWSIAGLLTLLERYNGLAYANAGVPSPYIWSGTDQYVRGKVVVDHGPIEPVVDKQLGCAGLILAIMALDPTVTFDTAPFVKPDVPTPPPALDGIWLQTSLNKLGATPVLVVDGIIGAGTRTAVKAFQASKGLVVDGVAGPATIAALTAALKQPIITKPPEIKLPPPGQVRDNLAPTFWGRVADLFRPKAR
jgi:lysozyme family protein